MFDTSNFQRRVGNAPLKPLSFLALNLDSKKHPPCWIILLCSFPVCRSIMMKRVGDALVRKQRVAVFQGNPVAKCTEVVL